MDPTMQPQLRTAIARGIDRLDQWAAVQYLPTVWCRRIRPPLYLGDCETCILGQLFSQRLPNEWSQINHFQTGFYLGMRILFPDVSRLATIRLGPGIDGLPQTAQQLATVVDFWATAEQHGFSIPPLTRAVLSSLDPDPVDAVMAYEHTLAQQWAIQLNRLRSHHRLPEYPLAQWLDRYSG